MKLETTIEVADEDIECLLARCYMGSAKSYQYFVVDKHRGVVLQGAPESDAADEDLWIWIDEVSGQSRKALTVWTRRKVMETFGRIRWEVDGT